MKIKLDLQEDDELRAYIKDLIRGQVVSIVRQDIQDVLHEVVERTVNGKISTDTRLGRFIEEEILKEIKKQPIPQLIDKEIKNKVDEKVQVMIFPK